MLGRTPPSRPAPILLEYSTTRRSTYSHNNFTNDAEENVQQTIKRTTKHTQITIFYPGSSLRATPLPKTPRRPAPVIAPDIRDCLKRYNALYNALHTMTGPTLTQTTEATQKD